ncbi:MAG: HAMP domain-containing histidine kinase [Planctomycetia bacterium]|nr:HAMP domain-containing histidine kinase [Planctomycetia bacterium]
MSLSPRGRSLFGQLVLPVVGLVLAAVLGNVAFSAWLAVRRSFAAARAGHERVVAALEGSRISLSPQVLDALHCLTGSHFVVWNTDAAAAGASTLSPSALDDVATAVRSSGTGAVVTIDGRRHSIGEAWAAGVRPERVFVLSPMQGLVEASLAAAWPVLAVAAMTLAVLVPLGLATTGRLARRISAVERHVERISRGEFGTVLEDSAATPAGSPEDEVGRLVAGVNRMSGELDSLRNTVVAGERQRLLGQLAAGFAHELRNAITGARLAIDLHRRRCHSGTAGDTVDESLAVACRQLDIVEEEVRGLLALGTPSHTAATTVNLDALVGEVRDLTAPRCEHAGVRLECGPAVAATVIGRHDALRAAVVNLALNAIDAAGRGGRVSLRGEADEKGIRIVVEDDGPGPPAALAAQLHEPFVTGKPEGVGLGLTVAKAVAEQHGGTLEWGRTDGRTRFVIGLPPATIPPERSA